jgi:choline dehydrogenase
MGVEYRRHGKEFRAFAKKEVIVSGGVYGSPLLLIKSGIGPKKTLAKGNVRFQ